MTRGNDTIRALIPLKIRKKDGRLKIVAPGNYRPSDDQMQDPHKPEAVQLVPTCACPPAPSPQPSCSSDESWP